VELGVIGDIDRFAALGGEWDALASDTEGGSPFRSNTWLVSWWRAYADPGARPYVLTVRDGGTLVGGLPMYAGGTTRAVPTERLRLMGDTVVGSTGLGAICAAGHEPEVTDAIVGHLGGGGDVPDVLDFGSMYADDRLVVALTSTFGERGWRVGNETAAPVPVADLPETWDGFLAGVNRNIRNKIRTERRRIEACGDVAIDRVDDPARLDEAIDDMARLFAESMSRRHGRPYDATERYKRFIGSACQGFLSAGALRLTFLTVDGQRVSFVTRFRHLDTMFMYQLGFATEWERFRAGNVLHGWAVQEALEEGCRCYDFGPGASQAKAQLGANRTRMLRDTRVYGPSSAGFAAARYDAARDWATKAGKRLALGAARDRLALEASWRRLGRL
jgi:CelD/BcsL family acetyltransferase involved in cellulose biosynthesis